MPSPLKEWRRTRREASYWKKARDRSASMREPDIVNEIDVAVMMMGQHITRYRSTGFSHNREGQLDELREVRLQLEACLGMMDNVLTD